MPLITTIHESLPYVDAEPTPAERAAAEALIAAERAAQPDDPQHALLAPLAAPAFSPLAQAELERIGSSIGSDPSSAPTPLKAIDMGRYEAPDLDDPSTASAAELEAALRQAYVSSTYLSARRQHLALLDSLGKNAWLVGNWQLEAELRALEAELAASKRDIDLVTIARRRLQDESGGEIRGLEDTWKRGVGRVLETEVAAESVRREVLEARKMAD